VDVWPRVATALACAAMDKQLAGIILFDLDPELTMPLARWLVRLMGESAPVAVLGEVATEDDLWLKVSPGPGGISGFRLTAGPLLGQDRAPRVIVVPDLARLNAAAARAAVVLLGADVAYLQRAGQDLSWQPADRWLTRCSRDEVGRVPLHLLDRLAVRIDAGGLRTRDRPRIFAEPPATWLHAVQTARVPGVSAAAADRVLEYLPAGTSAVRRDLTLARMARALAVLNGDSVVEVIHVDSAARLTGLASLPSAFPGHDGRDITGPGAFPEGTAASTVTRSGADMVRITSDEPKVLPGTPLSDVAPSGDPYPEDDTDPQREPNMLRVEWQSPTDYRQQRGHPIGSQPTRGFRDLALTSTILEAAKYQALRCETRLHHRSRHSIHVTGADLRSYRRSPVPGRLLVLLVDHTCRRGWDWYAALAPYLQWAYAARAYVGVVEVGAADAADELRARAFLAHNLLDPRVAAALERPSGRATPLADGLGLAAGLLRHHTQQGDATVVEALLVIVTDGRANVPLQASKSGQISSPVASEGVADAVDVARQIAMLHRVRSVVIDPGPRPYAHLTTTLADALHAVVVAGRPDDA
jgi:magnesium chelatase subunit D